MTFLDSDGEGELKSKLACGLTSINVVLLCEVTGHITYLNTTVLFGVATIKLVNSNTNAPKRKGTKFLHFLSQTPDSADASGSDTFNASATHLQDENVCEQKINKNIRKSN